MIDKEIIDLQKAGEYEKAFNAIVDSYSSRLYWHIRRFLCSHEEADDLMQDVFIKIWKALPSFRGESQIFTWIYRIATNEALNHLNKSRNRSMIDVETADAIISQKVDEDPQFNGNAIQRELHNAIKTLPDKQKLVFNLRYFDEMKYEDISKITGTSTGALKATYHHAYMKISRALKNIFLE